MKHHKILLCFLILLTSCAASVKDQVIKDAQSGQCDQAFAVFEKNATPEKVWQKSNQIGGYAAAGAATGAVMVYEAMLYTPLEVGIGAIICSPIIVLEAITKSQTNSGIECAIYIGSHILLPKKEDLISTKIWDDTKKWRLESYDELSQMLRHIIKCYADRQTSDSFLAAEKQLKSIRETLWDKLSDDEKSQVDALFHNINKQKNILDISNNKDNANGLNLDQSENSKLRERDKFPIYYPPDFWSVLPQNTSWQKLSNI